MTTIIVRYEDDDIVFGCLGHTGYYNPETKNNDLCVAVSTLCSMLVRFALATGDTVQECKDADVRMTVRRTVEMESVMDAAVLQFGDLARKYPGYISLDIRGGRDIDEDYVLW